jgi:uncharacterized Zn-binding protein involved in type VI secretion
MPAATRIGDHDEVDCEDIFRAKGSPDVAVNKRAWSRQTDPNTSHNAMVAQCKVCHVGRILKGSTTVFVNSLGAGRLGDLLDNSCTMVVQGSDNVNCGG